MIKRILVALDPDLDTTIATRYATDIAERHHAEVSGLAVADTRQGASAGGAIGSLYYEELVRKRMIEESRRTAEHLVHDFETLSEQAKVPHEELVEEGIPYKNILEDAKYNDLLVVGREPHFVYANPEVSTNTLARIIRRITVPALVPCQSFHKIMRVILAFDGSDAAVRTMQRFVQLQPFGTEVDMEIVHVRDGDSTESREASDRLLSRAASYVKAYGFSMVHEASLRHGSAHVRLLGHAELIGADLIVAGAHSVSAPLSLVFGSTTRVLLRECTVPLFIYH